jgi:hypothetical protein
VGGNGQQSCKACLLLGYINLCCIWAHTTLSAAYHSTSILPVLRN